MILFCLSLLVIFQIAFRNVIPSDTTETLLTRNLQRLLIALFHFPDHGSDVNPGRSNYLRAAKFDLTNEIKIFFVLCI